MRDPDTGRKVLIEDGYTNDDILFRRHVGVEETPVERQNRLISERHKLANKATTARLRADMLFLEVKRLDEQIEELEK